MGIDESDDVERLLAPVARWSKRFLVFVAALAAVVAWGAYAYSVQLSEGLAVTGMRDTVSWGLYISNFVFFIGISHVGALMSAILRLTKAEWRRPVTRMAEAITVCSLFVGAAMPIIDLGRPDRLLNVLVYGRIQSAILWDFLSIFTYLTGSLLFFYLFLIPDLAIARDRLTAVGRLRRWIYRTLSLGWHGAPDQRRRLDRSIGVLTILILPIAISVHTVVSWIFAMTLRVGWDSTIFGPYFVAGALFSGVASVLMAMALFTHFYKLQKWITPVHFRNLAYLLLLLDIVYIYFTLNEYLTVSYKGESGEADLLAALYGGPFAGAFWAIQIAGLVVPAFLLAMRRTRTTAGIVVAATLVNVTMWLKRYLIVVSTMATPQMPTDWGAYFPTWVEWSITAAAFAGFALLFALLSRFVPIVSIWEVQEATDAVPRGAAETSAPEVPA